MEVEHRQVDIGALMREARLLMKGTKRVVLAPVLLLAAIVFAWTFSLDPGVQQAAGVLTAMNVVLTLLSAAVAPGLTSIGLRRAAGQGVDMSVYVRNLRYFPHFLLISLIGIGIDWASAPYGLLGLLFVLVFGLFMTFAACYIVDARENPFTAIASSFSLVGAHLGQVLVLMLILFALVILSVFTVGLALIWVMPFGVILLGLVYRDASGLKSLPGGRKEAAGAT